MSSNMSSKMSSKRKNSIFTIFWRCDVAKFLEMNLIINGMAPTMETATLENTMVDDGYLKLRAKGP